MPRAALLSLHARVRYCQASDWEHPSLVQIWGPRYNVYTVAANDVAVFSLGRLPIALKARARAENTGKRIQALLGDRRMPFGQAAQLLKVHPNSLRYAAPSGTILLRWDGARQPMIRSVEPPKMGHLQARLELARRYLRIFGPTTPLSFAHWAGMGDVDGHDVFRQLALELEVVKTPVGDRWILASDEALLRAKPSATEATRLLPSGDALFLAWNGDRILLVPNSAHRAALWTTRVWPGALLVRGEIAGIWRRSAQKVSVTTWKRLARAEKESIEAEAQALPLAEPGESITVQWNSKN